MVAYVLSFYFFYLFFFLVLYMITILSQDVLSKIFLKFKYDEILKVFFNDDMKFVLTCNDIYIAQYKDLLDKTMGTPSVLE
jgi:hypothetical protein